MTALRVLSRKAALRGMAFALASVLTLVSQQIPTSRAAAGEVLIVTETVSGGAASPEGQAVVALGKTVVLKTAAEVAAMSAASVAAYDALVLGDATCRYPLPSDIGTLAAAAPVWGPAITGNVIIDGTDPVFHSGSGGTKLTNAAIKYASGIAGKTGLYVSLSCYYDGVALFTPVPLLSSALGGAFSVRGVACANDAHIVVAHPALAGVTDADLSNWGCSVHEGFDAWPPQFTVLAIARGIGTVYTAPDGSVGTPYILARGPSSSGLFINDVSRLEGDVGTTGFEFTISLLPASASPVSVTYSTANGTGSAASDYVAIPPTVANFAPGETTKTITVLVNGDPAPESGETFYVNLSDAVGAPLYDAQGVGTILDDDTRSLSIGNVTAAEGNSGSKSFTFTVGLDAPAKAGGVTFDIATTDGTAVAGSDYVAKSLTGQAIPVGVTSYTFAVLVNGDTGSEANETFFVNVSNVVGATVADGQGLGTVLNDDGAGQLLSIGNASAAEGDTGTTPLTFTVQLSVPASAGGVTFDIATNDGTAQAGSDYVAKALTGQAIPAGAQSYTFEVVVNGDLVAEANEYFFVTVTNVVGATVSTGQGVGGIQDDDTVVLTLGDNSVTEGDAGVRSMTFYVYLDRVAKAGGVTFDIATADVSAQAGADYVAKALSGQTIPAGSTSYTFEVSVNGDLLPEANETFLVQVSNVVGAQVGKGAGLGTIYDDDAVGGANLRITVPSAGSSLFLNWAGGTKQQSYTVFRYDTSSGTMTATSLPSYSTGYTDTSTAQGVTYCYVVAPHGSGFILELSDLVCALRGVRIGTVIPDLSLALNQTDTATLGWSSLANLYSLVSIPLDGSPVSTTEFPGAATSATKVVGPKGGCFQLAAHRGVVGGGVESGISDVVCGIPGFTTLGAKKDRGQQMTADEVTQRMKEKAAPLRSKGR